MKNLLLCSFLLFVVTFFHQPLYAITSMETKENAILLMQEEIRHSEEKIQRLNSRLQDHTILSSSVDHLSLHNAIITLEAKKILLAQFIDSPMLNDAEFRHKLLTIIMKENILPSDLTQLESVLLSAHQDLNGESEEN